MIYEEIELELKDKIQKTIIIRYEDGSMKSFPADPENPEYVAFLKQLEETA